MATYRDIASTETDPDSPVTATLMQALDDNPTAISEGATTAPYSGGALHPYNGVLVDDANSGLIYDFAVDGAVATVQTPDLESGYSYTFRVVNFSHGGGTNQIINIERYGITDNLLNTSIVGQTVAGGVIQSRRAGGSSADDYLPIVSVVVPQTPVKYVIIRWDGGASFTAGLIYMFRELDYSARVA